jgi:phage terminase small subunit
MPLQQIREVISQECQLHAWQQIKKVVHNQKMMMKRKEREKMTREEMTREAKEEMARTREEMTKEETPDPVMARRRMRRQQWLAKQEKEEP